MTSLLNNLIFAADPSAHVFGDRLYLYVSYDQPYTNTYDSMVTYHCLSTDDMINWIDHGRILHLDQVSWALSHMWAIDANYYNGKYYLTFCAIEKESSTFRTGLAVSDRPEGPFTDLGPIAGVEWGQDPAFFIDDDQTPYLIWGGRGSILIGELNSDLRSIKTKTIRNISEQVKGYEGPFLHKYADKYYLTYPALDGEKWPQRMCHAIADNPLGPYVDQGVFIPEYSGHSGTIHGSVVEFRSRWYVFYHSGWVSGSETARSLMCDEITYNADGRINAIAPTPHPTDRTAVVGRNWKIVLDAAVSDRNGGRLYGTSVARGEGSTGAGYLTGFTQQEYGFRTIFDVGTAQTYELFVRYRSDADRTARVLLGDFLFFDGVQNQSYEQYINRGTHFPSTNGEWQTLRIGAHHCQPGQYVVRFSHSHNLAPSDASLEVDSLIFLPVQDADSTK